jgi:MFS family permease
VTAPTRLITPRFALVVSAGIFYFTSLGMTLPTLPLYVEQTLGGSAIEVGLVIGAFAVGAIALRPYVGRLCDRIGRRPLLLFGSAMVGASVLSQVAIDAIPMLAVVRFIGGLGEAAFFVGAVTMITDMSPRNRRGEAISFWSVAVYGGMGFGPPLGIWLEEHYSFDVVWMVAAGAAFTACVIALFTRETLPADLPPPDRSLPLINRAAMIPGLFLFVCLFPLIAFTTFGALYMEELGAKNAGTVFLLYGLLVLAVRLLGAKLPDRFGPRVSGTIAAVAGGIGGLTFAAFGSIIGVYIGAAVLALGLSQLYPAAMLLSLTGVDQNESASVMGTVGAFFDLASSVGPVIIGIVVAFGNYRVAFGACGLIAFASLLVLRLDPRLRLDHPAHADPGVGALEPPPAT